MSDAPNIVCPECGGSGQRFVFMNTGEDYRTHKQGRMPCYLCRGAKTISAEHAERLKAGEVMRKARVAAGITIAQRAREWGVSPADVSSVEHGRVALEDVQWAYEEMRKVMP